MRNRTITATLAAAGLALTLAACASPNTVSDEQTGASETSLSPAEEVDGAGGTGQDTPTPSETLRTVFAFGETVNFTGPNPVDVTISVPSDYRPSSSAVGADQASNIKVDVTVTNKGSGLLDPAGIYLTAQSGGVEAASIYDSANGLNGSPSTSILPGQSTTFPSGFSVADPAQIVVELSAGFQFESVVFTNVALG